MIPILPVDIHHCIIDLLSDDKSTLSSCALVCHVWLHPARTHLFDTIRVMATTFDRFLAFLDTHSDVRPYVKTLHLLHRRGSTPAPLPAPELNIDTLSTILSHLSNVHTLHMGLLFLKGRSNAMSTYPKRFTLNQLRIFQCSRASHLEDSLLDIMDFICLFERIGTLKFEMLFWVKPARAPLTGWYPPGAVEVGHMFAEMNELWWRKASMMLGQLIGRSPGPRALTFHCGRNWSDICEIGVLLRTVGMHLRCLTLDFSCLCLRGPVSTAQVTAALSFASLSCLEDVHFVIYLEHFEETMDLGWAFSRVCADMLSTAARSQTLATITLTIQVPNGKPANLSEYAIDWAHLNESMRGLSALRRVNVLFMCLISEATPADDRALQIARQGLPIAASKEMLAVNIEYGCEELRD
ncbi:hypothetical protein C8T65DRAFT_735672 [Cerioporus squamosus]|nr:hypothetical protein C8T65DRAFT_735672 [Cerioporus squamosus]